MTDAIICWEGVRLDELPREKLYEAIETLMRMQEQQTTDIQMRHKMDRMGR